MIATGSQVADRLLKLLEASQVEAALWRKFFQRLGQRLSLSVEREGEMISLCEQLQHKKQELQNILDSRAWRWVSRYSRVKTRLLYFFQPSRSAKGAGL